MKLIHPDGSEQEVELRIIEPLLREYRPEVIIVESVVAEIRVDSFRIIEVTR